MDTRFKVAGLFLVSYLGLLSHLAIESMLLPFTKARMSDDEWQQLAEFMNAPGTEWIMALFMAICALPLLSSILAESRGSWKAVSVLGWTLSIIHAAHFSIELTEHFGGLGVVSLLFVVVPSLFASAMAWRISRTAA
ncbi:MAG: hypothetical protein AAGF92_02245 [Myxococcota bacterium]